MRIKGSVVLMGALALGVAGCGSEQIAKVAGKQKENATVSEQVNGSTRSASFLAFQTCGLQVLSSTPATVTGATLVVSPQVPTHVQRILVSGPKGSASAAWSGGGSGIGGTEQSFLRDLPVTAFRSAATTQLQRGLYTVEVIGSVTLGDNPQETVKGVDLTLKSGTHTQRVNCVLASLTGVMTKQTDGSPVPVN